MPARRFATAFFKIFWSPSTGLWLQRQPRRLIYSGEEKKSSGRAAAA